MPAFSDLLFLTCFDRWENISIFHKVNDQNQETI